MQALAALVWLRWRLLAHALAGTGRPDGVERLSRAVGALIPVAAAVLCTGVAIALALGGFLAGALVAGGSPWPLQAVRVGLLLVFVLALVVPLAAGGPGGVTGHPRLRLLPVGRRILHGIEMVAGLADPWIGPAVPALLLFGLGVLAGGAVAAGLVAVAGALCVGALLAAAGALLSLLVALLLRRRGRGEIATLVVALGLPLLLLVPTTMASSADRRGEVPAWAGVLPSEAFAGAVTAALAGRVGAAWRLVAILAVGAAVLTAASARVHRHLSESVEVGGSRRRSRGRVPRTLPGLGPQVSAVAFAQARTALRSVRGRAVVLVPGPMLAALAIVGRRLPEEIPWAAALSSDGPLLWGAGIAFVLYALLAFTANQFGSDGDALALELLAPASEWQLVLGKVLGCAAVLGVATLLCLACALAVARTGTLASWACVALGGAAAYLLMSPAMAVLSAVLPVRSDLTKTGPGGNPHGLAMLAGGGLILLASLPPGLIVGVVARGMGRPLLALTLGAIWLSLSAGAARVLLPLGARSLAARRDNVAIVASGR